jgi:hypothetical protein
MEERVEEKGRKNIWEKERKVRQRGLSRLIFGQNGRGRQGTIDCRAEKGKKMKKAKAKIKK